MCFISLRHPPKPAQYLFLILKQSTKNEILTIIEANNYVTKIYKQIKKFDYESIIL